MKKLNSKEMEAVYGGITCVEAYEVANYLFLSGSRQYLYLCGKEIQCTSNGVLTTWIFN